MKKIIFPLILTTFLLSACVGKNFQKPEVDLPETTQEQTSQNEKAELAAVENEQWWTIFNDDVLNKFEEEALKYNYDLKSAMAKVEQAKAKHTELQEKYNEEAKSLVASADAAFRAAQKAAEDAAKAAAETASDIATSAADAANSIVNG